jgi:hypothetical protein
MVDSFLDLFQIALHKFSYCSTLRGFCSWRASISAAAIDHMKQPLAGDTCEKGFMIKKLLHTYHVFTLTELKKTVAFLAYFPYFEKIKGGLWYNLAVCLCLSICLYIPPVFRGLYHLAGCLSVYSPVIFVRRLTRLPCCLLQCFCFLCGPCHIKGT